MHEQKDGYATVSNIKIKCTYGCDVLVAREDMETYRKDKRLLHLEMKLISLHRRWRNSFIISLL